MQQTWPLRKHDGHTEVSVCAVIGGFRSSAFCQFLCVCGLSILAVILIKGNENAIVNGRKGKQIWLNTTDKNKEQIDFVHKPNQHLISESRSNLTIRLFILWVDYWINKPNYFPIHEFINPQATGTLDMVWL